MNKSFKKNIYILQTIFCLLIFFFIFITKTVDKNYYKKIKQWFNFQINDSLIMENEKKYIKTLPVNLSVRISEPVENIKITSKFGFRDNPFSKNIKKLHKGLDLGANFGESVFSAIPGKVELAKNFGGYGKCIILDHGNEIRTLYAHCQKIEVFDGEYVNKRQKIATVGSTGSSTGPHLHFELIIHNKEQNPEFFLKI